MTTMNVMNIRNELTNFLRYSDVLTTTVRGTSADTDNFVATAGQTQFTLTNYLARDIRNLTVNAVAKYFLRDYTVSWGTASVYPVVTLNTGAGVGEAVVITYDYGGSEKIYPDLPRDDVTLTSFPRIGIELTSISTEPFGLGGMQHISDLVATIIVWAPVNKDSSVSNGYGGTADMESTMNLIRDALRTNAKSFYTFSYIFPKGRGPLIRSTNNKIFQMSQDFLIKFRVE